MATHFTYQDVTIIILAGGKSSRMGEDKGLLQYEDVSFVKRALSTSNSLTQSIILSVGVQNAHLYQGLGVKVIVDETPDLGPLGGIVSAIKQVNTAWFVLLSVDSPKMTTDVIDTLWKNKSGYEAVVFESHKRIHPLVGLYQTNTKDKWKQALAENKLKITSIVEGLKLVKIEADSTIQEAIQNINTPQEYTSLQNTKACI